MWVWFTIIIIIGIASWLGLRAYAQWKEMQHAEAYAAWKSAQRYVVLQALVPRNNDKTPLAAEQFFAALHGILRDGTEFQDQISFEIASYQKFVHFYIHVPQHLKEFVEGQIYAQYPLVEINEIEDYTEQLNSSQAIVGANLVFTKEDVYPVQTFQNFTVDPLSGITAVLGNLAEGQQLMVQIVAKPVSEDWQKRGVEFVAAKRLGVSLEKPNRLSKFFGALLGFVVLIARTIVSPGGSDGEKTAEEPKRPDLSAPEEAALKGIETKVTKLGFATKIRILAVAGDPYTARSRVESLTGAFKQYNTNNLNGFRAELVEDGQTFLHTYRERVFADDGMIMNTEELASIFHLPSESVATPNIVYAGSKKGEPPAGLPLEGQGIDDDITFFGVTDFRSFKHKFGIKARDRGLHMYTIGKTGTGKSTMLQNMILDDIKKGKGVAVVDPHGQLVEDVLERMPAHRINDVIYFNPADRDFPIGFNLFENVDEDLRSVVASGIVGIFKKLFAESWGPRLEYILRNAVIALLHYPDTTLLGVNRLLTDKAYRQRVIRKVTDPVIRDFFEDEFERYDPKFQREAIAPIQNKVGQFLSSSTIRNILGQPKSAFDMRKVMDEGKILLMNLSIGRIGEDSAALLGAMLITKIQLAAMSRADVPEAQRSDFYLYVDEFQNFATEAFAVILSEARKYHLNLTLTNQYIAQMPEVVAQAIFGNVGTIVSFRVGPGDASSLVGEFAPVFESQDMVNLPNRTVYVKMAIDGVTRPAFSATTLPPQDVNISQENLEKVIKVSRERYARPRAIVEQKIQEWSDDTQIKQAQEWRARVEGQRQGSIGKQINDRRQDIASSRGQTAVPARADQSRQGQSRPASATPSSQPVKRSSFNPQQGKRPAQAQQSRPSVRPALDRQQLSEQPKYAASARPAQQIRQSQYTQQSSTGQGKGSIKTDQAKASPKPMISDEDIQSLREQAEHFGTLPPGEEISLRDNDL